MNEAARTFKSTPGIFRIVLLLGVISCLGAAALHPQVFIVSYLQAYLLVLGTALGAMLLLLIHQLTGGRWGFRIQSQLSAMLGTLPWLLPFHIPLLFGTHTLYVWSRPGASELMPILQRKAWYLNDTFFYIRTAIFWTLWLLIAFLLRRQVGRQIREGNGRTNPGLGAWALIVAVLSMSFASVDWIMSIEPHFYSSIYGLIVLVGFLISAVAWLIFTSISFPEFFQAMRPAQENGAQDLGNLLLMGVMLWAYGSFSQLLVIWSGQLPDEILFYHKRFHPPWQALGWALVVLAFALPFLLLLWRVNKKRPRMLAVIAMIALFGHWLDLIWNVQPFFDRPLPLGLPFTLLSSLTLGGIWLLLFQHSFQKVNHGSSP